MRTCKVAPTSSLVGVAGWQPDLGLLSVPANLSGSCASIHSIIQERKSSVIYTRQEVRCSSASMRANCSCTSSSRASKIWIICLSSLPSLVARSGA